MRNEPKAANPWPTFVLLCTTFFMIVLDFSIVSIAMPAIQRTLHFDPGDLQWLISAYTIIFAGS